MAAYYYEYINNPLITLPERLPDAQNVYHLFPIIVSPFRGQGGLSSPLGDCGAGSIRNRLHDYLESCGIGTVIHYPIAPHKQECYANHPSFRGRDGGRLVLPITEFLASAELSLPMSPCMTQEQMEYVVKCVNEFK